MYSINSQKSQSGVDQFTSSCPTSRGGRRGQQLTQPKLTCGPFGLLPALGEPPFQRPQVHDLLDVVRVGPEELHVLALAIRLGSGLEELAVHLFDLPAETVDAVRDAFLFLNLCSCLFGGEAWLS